MSGSDTVTTLSTVPKKPVGKKNFFPPPHISLVYWKKKNPATLSYEEKRLFS